MVNRRKKITLGVVVALLLSLVALASSFMITHPVVFDDPIAPSSIVIDTQKLARQNAKFHDVQNYYVIRIIMAEPPKRSHIPVIDGMEAEFFIGYPMREYTNTASKDYVLEIWIDKARSEWRPVLNVTYGDDDFEVTSPKEEFKSRAVTYSNRWIYVNMWALRMTNSQSKMTATVVDYTSSTLALGAELPSNSVFAYPSNKSSEIILALPSE